MGCGHDRKAGIVHVMTSDLRPLPEVNLLAVDETFLIRGLHCSASEPWCFLVDALQWPCHSSRSPTTTTKSLHDASFGCLFTYVCIFMRTHVCLGNWGRQSVGNYLAMWLQGEESPIPGSRLVCMPKEYLCHEKGVRETPLSVSVDANTFSRRAALLGRHLAEPVQLHARDVRRGIVHLGRLKALASPICRWIIFHIIFRYCLRSPDLYFATRCQHIRRVEKILPPAVST